MKFPNTPSYTAVYLWRIAMTWNCLFRTRWVAMRKLSWSAASVLRPPTLTSRSMRSSTPIGYVLITFLAVAHYFQQLFHIGAVCLLQWLTDSERSISSTRDLSYSALIYYTWQGGLFEQCALARWSFRKVRPCKTALWPLICQNSTEPLLRICLLDRPRTLRTSRSLTATRTRSASRRCSARSRRWGRSYRNSACRWWPPRTKTMTSDAWSRIRDRSNSSRIKSLRKLVSIFFSCDSCQMMQYSCSLCVCVQYCSSLFEYCRTKLVVRLIELYIIMPFVCIIINIVYVC